MILNSHLGLHKSSGRQPIPCDILHLMKERDHISKFLRVRPSKTLEKALEKTQGMLEAAKKGEANTGFRD